MASSLHSKLNQPLSADGFVDLLIMMRILRKKLFKQNLSP